MLSAQTMRSVAPRASSAVPRSRLLLKVSSKQPHRGEGQRREAHADMTRLKRRSPALHIDALTQNWACLLRRMQRK